MSRSFSESSRPDGHPPPPRRNGWRRFTRWLGRPIAVLTGAVTALTILVMVLMIIIVSSLSDSTSRTEKDDEEVVRIDSDDQYRVATHEAGHAIMSRLVLPKASIESLYVRTRRQEDDKLLGKMSYTASVSNGGGNVEMLEKHALVDFAGQVAEEILHGKTVYKNYTDTDHATDRLYERLRRLREENRAAYDDLLRYTFSGKPRQMSDVVEDLRKRSRERAEELLKANRDAVIQLANLLIVQSESDGRRVLNADKLDGFFQGAALADPKAQDKEKDPE